MKQGVRMRIQEVPYVECKPSQRVAWDWLWTKLLGDEADEKPAPAQTPDDQPAPAPEPVREKRKVKQN